MKQKSPRAARNAMSAVLLLGFLGGIQTADPIISSVALIRASSTLHFSASTTALASSISTLALAATVIASGLLADHIGRRRLLMIALVVAAAGDIIVAGSTSAPLYLLGRTIAGIGLGAIFAAAFAYVRTVAAGNVGAALGQFGALGGITTMVGGFVGGTLVTSNWRLAFLVVPVFCVLGLVLVPVLLPKAPRIKTGPIDWLGLSLIAVSTTGILYGISHASTSLTDPATWQPLAAGVLALIVLAVHESRARRPVFPVGLFRSPVFVAAALTVLVWNFAQAVTVLQLSNLWQYIERYTPTMVTFGQLPFSLIAIIASVMVGRSMSRGKSPRSRILLGFGLMAVGFLSLAVLPLGHAYGSYLPALALIGFGLPYAIVPSGQLFMSEAPAKSFGPVTSSKTAMGQFGYALGLAGSMVLVSNLTDGGIVHRLVKAGVPPSQTGRGLDAVTQYVNTGVPAHSGLGHQALQAAATSYTHAFASAMLLVAMIVAATGLIAYVLLMTRPARAGAKL
jgi:MFS family permease